MLDLCWSGYLYNMKQTNKSEILHQQKNKTLVSGQLELLWELVKMKIRFGLVTDIPYHLSSSLFLLLRPLSTTTLATSPCLNSAFKISVFREFWKFVLHVFYNTVVSYKSLIATVLKTNMSEAQLTAFCNLGFFCSLMNWKTAKQARCICFASITLMHCNGNCFCQVTMDWLHK